MRKIFTKRNAVLGWLTWIVGKRAAKRKLRQRRGRLLAIGGAAASVTVIAVGAAAVFARRHGHTPPQPS
jgi:hypothetical protein